MPEDIAISISSMWGIPRFEDIRDFVKAAHRLGFTHIEANYQISTDAFSRLLQINPLSVSSVHSPCPSPQPQAYRLSMASLDENERETAVQHALATVDSAARLSAKVVVLHVGYVPLEKEETRLREIFRQGSSSSSQFAESKKDLIALRTARKGPHLEAAFRSLQRVLARARQRGITLGLETRYYFREIPNLEEMEYFLNELGDGVGYWHDVGHGENLHRLGFTPHRDWLTQLGHRMIGIHLHDIQGLSDHKAVGLGDMDFTAIAPFIPPRAIRVCEFNHENSEEDVRQGLSQLRIVGII